MGFTNPFSSPVNTPARNAGAALRNRFTGGGTTQQKTNTADPLAKAGEIVAQNNANVSRVRQAGRDLGAQIFGRNTAKEEIPTENIVDEVEVDPLTTGINQSWDALLAANNPAKLAANMDFGENSDIDLYNNTLNDWMGKGDQAVTSGVNQLNATDYNAAYNTSRDDLLRALLAESNATKRSTGASMATRGLAGSGAYNDSMNAISANANRGYASGVAGLFDQLTGRLGQRDQAIANMYNQQAANRYGTGQQAATSAVTNRWSPLTNALALYGYRSAELDRGRQLQLQEMANGY
jgi:hypothetical protein